MSVRDYLPQERIETCGQCGRTLPLAKPAPGQLAIRWVCNGCSASYQAVLAVDSLAEALDHVRPAGLVFDRKKLVHPPEAIARFVKKAVGAMKPDHERRRAAALSAGGARDSPAHERAATAGRTTRSPP